MQGTSTISSSNYQKVLLSMTTVEREM